MEIYVVKFLSAIKNVPRHHIMMNIIKSVMPVPNILIRRKSVIAGNRCLDVKIVVKGNSKGIIALSRQPPISIPNESNPNL